MIAAGLSVHGIGCISAFGRGWEAMREGLHTGFPPPAVEIGAPEGIPPTIVRFAETPETPPPAAGRLRRAGRISSFACAAAWDAVQESGGLLDPARTALVFASSNGSAAYTSRFFEGVEGSRTGSPLLFPETVYNAPASHAAAMLGLDGPVLTLVGDAAVGIQALSVAGELLGSGSADRCLVLAAEELDWMTCEGYRRWGWTGFPGGPVLTEGAFALVLGRASGAVPQIAKVHPGGTVRRIGFASEPLRAMAENLVAGKTPDLAVLPDAGEAEGIVGRLFGQGLFPGIRTLAPKRVVGEAFAFTSLLQCACALDEVSRGTARRVLVPVLGWAGQFGGASVCGG